MNRDDLYDREYAAEYDKFIADPDYIACAQTGAEEAIAEIIKSVVTGDYEKAKCVCHMVIGQAAVDMADMLANAEVLHRFDGF